jgi:alcohol dehydrogenase
MRAAVLREFNEDLDLCEVPMPACDPDGVIVRVLACGICRSDYHGWAGEHARIVERKHLGHIGGHEYAGEVVEAGPLAKWKPGDRVIAPFILACGTCPDCAAGLQTICANQRVPGFTEQGAFAEYIHVPFSHNLQPLPQSISPELAAALGCRVTTAWHALTGRAAVQAGEWLAVIGAGGVGLSAAILARALGARVIVVDVVKAKLDHALALGMAAAVDATTTDAAAAIRDLTRGGAHVAIEALGLPQTVNTGIECLRPLGRHVQIGMPTGQHARMEVNMNQVYMKSLSLYGTRGMPSWRYPSLLTLIETGQVDLSPLIARRVALSGLSEELRAFRGPTPPGVAVITDMLA